MAANMFVVNEVKAMDEKKDKTTTSIQMNIDSPNATGKITSLPEKVLNYKNYINFFCGVASYGVNNYFKWWNYNQGRYWSLGCYGWRSGSFIKDIFQLDINLNLIRGGCWTILHIIVNRKNTEINSNITPHLIFNIITGFISVPLTMHFSIFSIAVSLDSIIWELVTIVRKDKAFSSPTLNYDDYVKIKNTDSDDDSSN